MIEFAPTIVSLIKMDQSRTKTGIEPCRRKTTPNGESLEKNQETVKPFKKRFR